MGETRKDEADRMEKGKNESRVEVYEMDNVPKPLDGGWGWMVVLGTALCHVIFGIIVRSFGVTYIELLEKYGGSATATGWIGAINMSASGLLSPLVSALCMRFTCRSVAMFGGMLLALGVIGTAYAPNLGTVYFTFGVMAGVGIAFGYTPGYIIVGEYFEKRKALAMSLATFASGIGSMFPPVMLYLFGEYGYSGALLIIGGISLHCCVGGAIYRPLKDNYTGRKSLCVEMKTIEPEISNGKVTNEPLCRSNSSDSKGKDKDRKTAGLVLAASLESIHSFDTGDGIVKSTSQNSEMEKRNQGIVKFKEGVNTFDKHTKETENEPKMLQKTNFKERKESIFHKPNKKQKVFDWKLLKKSRFLSLCYGIFCNACNLGLISAYVPVLAMERNIPASKAVSLLTVSGISSTIGTLSFGYVSDLKQVKPWRIYFYIFGLLVIGITTTINPLAQTFPEFAAFSATRAVFAGYIMSQRATIVSDIVGRARINHAVGMVLFSTALGFLFGRAVGGIIKDSTGMYEAAFYIAGVLTVVGSGVMLFSERCYARKQRILLEEQAKD